MPLRIVPERQIAPSVHKCPKQESQRAGQNVSHARACVAKSTGCAAHQQTHAHTHTTCRPTFARSFLCGGCFLMLGPEGASILQIISAAPKMVVRFNMLSQILHNLVLCCNSQVNCATLPRSTQNTQSNLLN